MLKTCSPILILILFSCSNQGNSKKTNDTEIVKKDTFPIKQLFVDTSQEEGWGADIRISIVEIKKNDTSITYIANSSHAKGNVGLQIMIPTNTPDDKKAYAQIMILRSSGENSDNLVRILAKLYKEKTDTSLHFVTSKPIAFIDLDEFAKKEFGQVPGDNNGLKSLKVFFESENEDEYAELYININEKDYWIELKEKDEGYRKGVLKSITTK